MGSMSQRMLYGAKTGFTASAAFALFEIFGSRKMVDRRAQIARFVYWTVPVTCMGTGWMGAVELGKVFMGRKNEWAWVVGSTFPAGMGIWTRNFWGGFRTGLFLSVLGVAYQYSS